TGVVGITALFITIISFLLGQQSIAILSAVFTGAVFGFLPHNWNPAKIFMGDSGSMFLGLGLAVLSIMGGAKLALASMVLGIPILGLVGLTMLGLILWVDQRLRQRGLPIRPGGPPPELTPGGGETMSPDDMACDGRSDAPDPGSKVHATVTPPLTGS